MVGDDGVGKTSLLITYISDKFPKDYCPQVFDNYAVTVMIGGDQFTFGLFDTNSTQEYDGIRPLAYPNTDVFVICFSIANPASFENVKKKWLQEIQRDNATTPFILVGTQMDLRNDQTTIQELAKTNEKPITNEQGNHMAEQLKAVKYVECSALTKENMEDVFDEAILASLEPPSVKKRLFSKLKTVAKEALQKTNKRVDKK